MKKIGIMGGTFNPIHYGHLFLAENAFEQMNLDEILFMPSNNPPHKINKDIVANEHRKAMVQLAICDNPHFKLSTLELEREGITYTADTLSILTKEQPDTEFYFLVGADSFLNLQNWKDPKIILSLCTLLVFERDKVGNDIMNKHLEYLKSTFPGAKISLLHMPTIQISSAMIRDRIANRKSIRYYVPDEVMTYIEKHQLYSAIAKE
ncbi:MAG: nicotinate-nucleotide adenylyltransferase [Clostridiales bacterium]|nr:nicotinate-nucleotide adenylyltransferase [Clostridiales bacterium]